jgi:hypothetical protein
MISFAGSQVGNDPLLLRRGERIQSYQCRAATAQLDRSIKGIC